MKGESSEKLCRVVVLLSGNGSNLQALIDSSSKHFDIVAVISNQTQAYGLERARKVAIDAICLDHKDYSSRASFDQALAETLHRYQPDLVVLAGFMRILSSDFVKQFQGRIVNIHPSLLPLYPGLNTHQRVLDAGDASHGATVHFVTEALDMGPHIIQVSVPVQKTDSVDTLAQRVQEKEHLIYPMAVKWFAQKRLQLRGSRVFLDGNELEQLGHQLPSSY